jgi:hypothetical protein
MGRLLWASRVPPGATADITIVRKDKLAEAFALKRPGLPETHATFLGDHGYGGLGNVEKEGSDQCVLVPVHKKQIKTEADREYNRRLQHERAPIECFWARIHNVAGAMPQPLKGSLETAGLHLRGILAMTNRSTLSNPLTTDETRAHRAWQAERAEQIAAGRGVPVEAVEGWSGDEPEPVELTPEQVRDGRLAAITQHTRVLKEFAQNDPIGALRRWGELHPGNTRRMKELIEGLVRMGVGQAPVARVGEQEEASDALEEADERLRGARRDFIDAHGEPDFGRDEPAWINQLTGRSEESKAARAARARLQRREKNETKQADRARQKLDEAIETCSPLDHAPGRKGKAAANRARDAADQAHQLAIQSLQKTRDELRESDENLRAVQFNLTSAREAFDAAIIEYGFRVNHRVPVPRESAGSRSGLERLRSRRSRGGVAGFILLPRTK